MWTGKQQLKLSVGPIHTPPTLLGTDRQSFPRQFTRLRFPESLTITGAIFGGLPMRARIYQPARTAMQSGTAKTHTWVLEFAPASARDIDPLMGWTSSDDTQSQVRLRFETRAAAEAYATEHGIAFDLVEPKPRRANIRPRGYGENFATDRKGAWTH